MGVEFTIPNDPAELWSEGSSDKLTMVVSDHSLDFRNETIIVKYAEDMSYALCGDNPLCICEQSKFDIMATIVKEWSVLPGQSRVQLLDALSTSMVCLSAWMDGVLSSPEDSEERSLMSDYRSAYKMYIFFSQWIAKVSTRETVAVATNMNQSDPQQGGGRRKKKAGPNEWSWSEQAMKLLKSVSRCMALDLWKVFRPSRPDDAVLVSLIQLSNHCMSSPLCVKDAHSVEHAGQIMGLTALRYQQIDAVAAALVDLLNQYEHTPAMVAEILRYSVAEWDDGRLAAAVIQEISAIDASEYERQQNATGEKAGVRSVAAFVGELAEKLPKLMATQIALLLPHLGGKAWTLRSGIITAIGHLLAKAFDASQDDGNKEDQEAVLARLRTKQHLLDILCERTRDQSSYTRKAVLQTWQYLAEKRAIPLGHWQVVTTIATGRLEDKSSLVRKEAMRLMGCLMLHNPFGPSLPLDRFMASLELHSSMLDRVMPTVMIAPSQTPPEEAPEVKEEVQNDSAITEEDLTTAAVEAEPQPEAPEEPQVTMEGVEAAQTPAEVGWDGTVEELQALVASLELAVDFSKSLTASMPSLVNLLASSTVSDVQDSIALLLTCKQFEIVGAPEAIRKMLSLIFARDQNVKDKVIEALDQLYLSGWAGNNFTSAQAAQNLVNLACGANLGELGSLEEIVKCFADKNLITVVTVHELWELADKYSRDIHEQGANKAAALRHLRGAIAILSMAVGIVPGTMDDVRVKRLLSIVFNRARGDALTSRNACVALGRIPDFADEVYSPVRNDVYTALVRAIISSEIPDSVWYTVAEASLNALYSLHPKPEEISSALIRNLATQAFDGRDQDENPPPSYLVSKVFFLVGEVSLRHLVLIEKSAKHVRRVRLEAERKAAESSGKGSSKDDEEDINAELGVGGVAADAELDNMKEAAERQIVNFQNGIVKPFAKLIINTCRHPSFNTADSILKSSALLALTKLMVVDVKICEGNLQLLFTLLQNRVVEPAIRSNLVIALGDLALRFPNSLEPWTEHVYRPLSDPDVSVRKTAMMVLTHLILNDMMKVKGHIAKMAACLEDSDDRVSSMASLFFHELAKKEYKGTSPIYNLLPDMLSVLSRDTTLSNAQFQSVMQQLLVHIKKDKHGDALIEKLCQRCGSTEDIAQWRNIAFCMSQLPISDKGIKKLMECHASYKNALSDDETAQTILSIIAKVKKSATKAESKELVSDLESKVLTIISEWKEINGDSQDADGDGENDSTAINTNTIECPQEALKGKTIKQEVDDMNNDLVTAVQTMTV